MKIEVGMYVRYANVRNIDKIAKVISIIPPEFPIWEEYYRLDNGDGAIPSSIIKVDSNLINLIEVGDYVNGAMVLGFDETYFNGLDRRKKPKKIGVIVDKELNLNNHIKEVEIKTIVTKEQFESLMYEVK